METYNKIFLEKNQKFIDKGIIKTYVSENDNFIFNYKIDKKLSLPDMVIKIREKGFNALLHNWECAYMIVNIPILKNESYDDKIKTHRIIVHENGEVEQTSPTSFDKALETSNTFLEAIEDLFSN